ncbi:MAG TPA: DUF305 domain-containing protein [Rhizomicrobium sp.]|nr:DUF305 domain-containing protein [Rhizomicrobium sp.]
MNRSRKSAVSVVALAALLEAPILLTAAGVAGSRAGEAESMAGSEAGYLAENNAAMTKMMDGMTVKPTGDVDRDFVAVMVPHHQGAIDMAVAVLRYGHNEKIRRLAQEIIVDQQQEIAAMRFAVGETLPPSVPVPTMPAPASTKASN